MTAPYTETEVNAAIAATIAEYQQKLDSANARVDELEAKHDRIRIAVRALLRNPLMSAGRFIDELVKEFDQ